MTLEIKKTFANRVFMYSDKKYDNKVFEVKNTMPRKNKKLKITDDIVSYQLTIRQKEAMNYDIKSVRMIERMKPLIKDLGLIMKE